MPDKIHIVRISALYVHPVKSFRGLSVPEAWVGDRGFEFDRRFMLVDENGHFLTQRTLPRMCLLETAIEGDRLRVSAPGVSLELPLRPTAGEPRTVKVWRSTVEARSLGPDAAAQLGAFLGVPCELVYMPDEVHRACNPEYAPGSIVSFADGYPFLLATTASLEELGRRGAPVEMVRFRPNLVVDGAEPFAEDQWRRVRIGEVEFRVVKPCDRCSIPTVDPATGETGVEPTRTLASFRKRGNEVLFGQNLIALAEGVVRVGDPVEPLPD